MRTLLGICFLPVLLALSSCRSEPATVDEAAVKTVEPHRPNFHFTPPEKWMNDPNGMVYFEGEYHLFYQYYPDSTVWGPMHWGHAVSTDLGHWEHLPIALYPDSLGYIFSGSAIVDWKNTSGFGQDGQPPMVAMFTYHNPVGEAAGNIDFQYQGIAYSNDKGRSWTKYEGNPVVPNPGIRDFRDTKVIRDTARDRWLMVLAAWDHSKFYSSPDLKNWTFLSDFGKEWGVHGGVWECPDFFPVTVEGTDTEKWVLLQSLNPGGPNGGSGTQYFIGDFDGQYFTLDPEFAPAVTDSQAVWLDWGRDNYAGVTWSDAPDQRRLFIGWMSNWDYAQVVPTQTWRSAMTLPRELKLLQTPEGLRLQSLPVPELQQLRRTEAPIDPDTFTADQAIPFYPEGTELILRFTKPQNTDQVGIRLRNAKGESYRIGYDAATNSYFSDRRQAGKTDFSPSFATAVHYAPRQALGDTLELHLFFDVASVELFADDGMINLTDIYFPTQPFDEAFLLGGEGLEAVQIYKLGE
ncbi:MAG: glycoside hydrolase family 32 protein [Phaeodactylibacter sp.]|nr:glycoside hydrolase family 32 protein [Phaeodactylibacter sp.]